MAKKKIGTSQVTNGEARDWFTINDQLDRGVYQLIAEYTGTNSYKPSHDIKKLIIGWYTEFQNLETFYKIDENIRNLTVTGKLVGYDNSNIAQPLKNRNVSIKIGSLANKNKSVYEQQLDGVALSIENSSKNVIKTDEEGNFTFNVIVPISFTDWHYKLIIAYEGDDDYISAINISDLYIGKATTFTSLHPEPSYHIATNGSITLQSRVLLNEDVENGSRIEGADFIKYGVITFYMSKDAKTWYHLTGEDSITYYYSDVLNEDGLGEIRISFNFDTSEVTTRYFKAVYSGSELGLGYNPSASRIVQIKIDAYGDNGDMIVFDIDDLDKQSKAIFLTQNEATEKTIYIKYGTDLKPVPEGTVRFILYDEE